MPLQNFKKINSWLEEVLPQAVKRASSLRFIVEVVPDTTLKTADKLGRIPDVKVISIVGDRFILIEALPEALPKIEAIEEVILISAETLVWTPFLEKIRLSPFGPSHSPRKSDPYLGEVSLSPIEIEFGPFEGLAKLPLIWARSSGERIITTKEIRDYLGVPKDNKIKIKVGVIDTGGSNMAHHFASRVEFISTVPGEPLGIDGQGHGTHCQSIAFGRRAWHPRFGVCEGMALPEEIVAVKGLSNAGFGTTSSVLEAVFRCWEKGCKVVNMSLGSPLQGSVTEDPLCRLIDVLSKDIIFVVAAGNSGNKDGWKIGSPATSPKCIAVGSWSITREDRAGFSSVGPSGDYYRRHPDIWERDLEIFGEDLIKPDCVSPGGDDIGKERILAGIQGWYDPIGDIVPTWGALRGTSMSAPVAAGIIALALDKGIIKNATDVKAKLKATWCREKSIEIGYGLLSWQRISAIEI